MSRSTLAGVNILLRDDMSAESRVMPCQEDVPVESRALVACELQLQLISLRMISIVPVPIPAAKAFQPY